jgi:hypothetical protein
MMDDGDVDRFYKALKDPNLATTETHGREWMDNGSPYTRVAERQGIAFEQGKCCQIAPPWRCTSESNGNG